MNQDISICVLTENEMGWTEPFELDICLLRSRI